MFAFVQTRRTKHIYLPVGRICFRHRRSTRALPYNRGLGKSAPLRLRVLKAMTPDAQSGFDNDAAGMRLAGAWASPIA